MKVVIVHYHLRRGGVTRVIESTQAALRNRGVEVLVISGEHPTDSGRLDNVTVIPGLNYRKTAFHSVAEGLADALQETAEAHFGSEPDLWHFHNHSLGKNVLTPLVVHELAKKSQRLLLQMHDFPEDGRPQNYVAQRSFFDLESEFTSTLYPRAPQVHYATINKRDFGFLKSAGMGNRLHLLANSVNPINLTTTPKDRPFSQSKRFLLYPTRAIRRKNIGELLLLALANGNEIDFATSLTPDNPEWKPTHDRWVAKAKELHLPIQFGISQTSDYSFEELFGWSDAHLTTSIAEGFGLAFLEPWLAGKSIVGRNLTRITEDFSDSGLTLNHLYDRIEVPLDWINRDRLRKEADMTLRRIYLAYNRPLPKRAIEQTLSRWIANDCVDFGMLNETLQLEVIDRAARDKGALQALNLSKLESNSETEIERGGQIVADQYGEDKYGERLIEIYKRVAKSSPSKQVKNFNPRKVLEQFLDPRRLNLLRT